MSRNLFWAITAGTLCVLALSSETQAGGGTIQTQVAPYGAKGLSLTPRVVPMADVLPFYTTHYYPQYYFARTSARVANR